jgi:hypothetical protein
MADAPYQNAPGAMVAAFVNMLPKGEIWLTGAEHDSGADLTEP